jgi:histidyl-tRNA synthetase
MRAVDKYDRLGLEGVRALLTVGRKDQSGDVTAGAGLDEKGADSVIGFMKSTTEVWTPLTASQSAVAGDELTEDQLGSTCYWNNEHLVDLLTARIRGTKAGEKAKSDLSEMFSILRAAGYGSRRIRLSSEVVRGLEYYTGPVFEAELTFEVKDEKGRPVRFGSVGGGGRYDDLVARFTGQKVPATGFSIGVSRLQAALSSLGSAKTADGPVIVTVMEKERIGDYQKMVQTLRAAGIRAELYLGNPKKFGKQLEYADKRNAPCVVIQGSDEKNADPPLVVLKDLVDGAKAAAAITDNKEWKEARPAQVSVKETDLVAEVKKILARHAS